VSIDYSIVVNDLDVVEEKLNEIVEENQLIPIELILVVPVHTDLDLEMDLPSIDQRYDV
jgi:hypothetical protein